MKYRINLKTLILATLIIPFGVSCSDDDDNGGSNHNNSKRITRIIEESQGSISESILTYDEQGRVVKVKKITNSEKVTNEVCLKTYYYGESIITQNDIDKNYQDSTHTYTLSDGIIMKDSVIRNGIPIYFHFEYNKEGYWNKYLEYKEIDNDLAYLSWAHLILWENGNLSNIRYLGVDKQYSYSTIPWTQGMIFDLTPYIDPILFSKGYFGKTPNYLPSEFDNTTYQYTLSDSLVTKIIKTVINPYDRNYSHTSVIKYIWE